MIARFINEINTTSLRIIATLGLTYMTALRYMASGLGAPNGYHIDKWTPGNPWLLFIWGMAGVEGAVLIAKRLSDYEYKRIQMQGKAPQVTADTANVTGDNATVNVNTTDKAQGPLIPDA